MVDKRKDKGSPVVVALEDAERESRRRKGPVDPPAHIARNGVSAQQWPGLPPNWTPNALGLPIEDPCPVEPVGHDSGMFYFLDSGRQLRTLSSADLTHSGMQGLFYLAPNWPEWAFPRHGRATARDAEGKPKPPPIKSFNDDDLRRALMLAAGRKGLFNPSDKLRGRGAWRMRGGGVLYHAGECLWTVRDGRFVELGTGMHEGHLYPRLVPIPDPWTGPIGEGELMRSIGALFTTLRRWQWERPDIDPVLLLGWIGVAYLGGALDWRTAMLLLGDKGTGKSTLQRLLQLLFGDALFHSADTTAAGIYQRMAQDARPVAVDELEPGADPRKVANVVQLMRDASSGAVGRRGGSDGSPAEFQMRSAFLFSAINNPIQKSQDLSRVAILRLRDLEGDQAPPPAIDQDITGRVCLARLMLQWPRYDDTFEAFATALRSGKHKGRGADTYGTLLACAELLLGAELTNHFGLRLSEDPAYWTEHLAASALPEVEDAMQNWRACIHHLLTTQVHQWRAGKRQTIGALLAELEDTARTDITPHEARRELEDAGLGLLLPGEVTDINAGYVLAVPSTSSVLASLFEGTEWAAAQGGHGSWKDALRQAPASIVLPASERHAKDNRFQIAGLRHRCSLIVLSRFHAAS